MAQKPGYRRSLSRVQIFRLHLAIRGTGFPIGCFLLKLQTFPNGIRKNRLDKTDRLVFNVFMNGNYKRKKQPQVVRAQLLEAAAHVVIERGLGGLTLDLVAQRAGVSKGGLIHHFPGKQELVEGLFNELLSAFENAIKACMDQDPEPRGRFFRAYVRASFLPKYGVYDSKLIGACALAMHNDRHISDYWHKWLNVQLEKYGDCSNRSLAYMVRYASDGLWLEQSVEASTDLSEVRKIVFEHLIKLTYEL